MKLKLLIFGSALALLPSCSTLGISSSKKASRDARLAWSRGFAEGRAVETRRQQQEQEMELSKPQPKSEFYEIELPAHTNSEGVNISSHKSIFEFFTD